jgi:hypothetical protein
VAPAAAATVEAKGAIEPIDTGVVVWTKRKKLKVFHHLDSWGVLFLFERLELFSTSPPFLLFFFISF